MHDPARRGRGPLVFSVFLRCAAIVAVMTAIVATALSFKTSITARTAAVDGVRELAAGITPFAATQIGGAVRFSKPEDAVKVLGRLIEQADGIATGAIVLDAGGTLFAQAGRPADDGDPVLDLGRAALGGATQWADDGRIALAVPVIQGAGGDIVGALVTVWTPEPALARIAAANRQGYLIAAGLFLGLLGVAAVALRTGVSQPLRQVGAAMSAVASGDYDRAIPAQDRRDEIGEIAGQLDQLRRQLAKARAATEDSVFKGGGFEGSSAALLLADATGTIRFANTAFHRLAREALQADPAGDPSGETAIAGRPLSGLAAELAGLDRRLASGAGFPWQLEILRGERRISLVVNPIHDGTGARAGAVVEWDDVTERRMNGAAVAALHANQAVAELTTDGRIVAANANFATLIGRTPEQLTEARLSDLTPGNGADSDLSAAVGAGQTLVGRFTVRRHDGGESVIDGSCLPVLDGEGRAFRMLLIGNDVTASEQAIAAAEAHRLRLAAEQREVVDALRAALARLSEGDLGVTIDTPFSADYDQLRHDFNRAAGTLETAIQAVADHARSILGEAAEITSAADDLSRRTEHQAATLEQTAAAVAQLTASVGSAADGARKADEVVADARRRAEDSGGVVEQAVTAMGEIEASSARISKIIGVIDDIAFQTNLLALNAGVEAARAGDAGRGFAVVASEVRALAQRSSDAAREINELISASGQNVGRGVALVGDAGAALKRIVASVGDISAHVSTIAASAQEQSAGLGQINAAMSQLDQVTQQNAAMFEETTAASHALAREAETLTATTARFRTSARSGDAPAAVQSSRRPPAPATAAAGARPLLRGATAPALATAAPATADDDWEDF
ncbi:methyl-accepting chemotaxis protein [Palleronia sp. KMU-117]|uniref:methyl-accepting chemotaxis protein n=1 Tax=Palleronia sp. KMU-117 TaxID=3434108 RepID=UPI003D7188CE